MSSSDVQRLQLLVAERATQPSGAGSEEGYRLGPDDLLDIRIPDLLGPAAPVVPPAAPLGGAALPPVTAAPVFEQGIRVGADGTINVPILGQVRAEGLTPHALEDEIGRRLIAAGILRAPQVNVLVAEYRSRVVAVIGSVERPGLYPVTRPGATVADLLWVAGGPNKDAGRVVQFSPAGMAAHSQIPGDGDRDARGAAGQHRQIAKSTIATDGTEPLVDVGDPESTGLDEPGLGSGSQAAAGRAKVKLPIRIDLALLLPASAGQATKFNPPVRQGDVISVSPAGTAQVDGWVTKPGAYPVTRNLTLTGALAAAGGTNFASDRSQVTVQRVLGPGEERSFKVDLDAVAEGRAEDFPVTDGDAVYVPASSTRVVPWGIWTFVTTIFRFAATTVAY